MRRKHSQATFIFAIALALILTALDRFGAPILANAHPNVNVATTTPDWYSVQRVVDGDTIVVVMNGKNVKVRLIGLDTPEIVDPRKPVQCFAKEASNEMHTILDGQYVRLEQDPTQDTYDKYGRLLAYVYAPLNVDPKGLLVNEYLIAEGYGHEYTYDVPYEFQKEFKAAETKARQEQKGLWAPGMCAQ